MSLSTGLSDQEGGYSYDFHALEYFLRGDCPVDCRIKGHNRKYTVYNKNTQEGWLTQRICVCVCVYIRAYTGKK